MLSRCSLVHTLIPGLYQKKRKKPTEISTRSSRDASYPLMHMPQHRTHLCMPTLSPSLPIPMHAPCHHRKESPAATCAEGDCSSDRLTWWASTRGGRAPTAAASIARTPGDMGKGINGGQREPRQRRRCARAARARPHRRGRRRQGLAAVAAEAHSEEEPRRRQ